MSLSSVFRNLLIGLAVLAGAQALALDKVRFATNWKAQAEHGGFYQALVDGTYEKYGLDVEISMGGPQVNNRVLLPVGRIDFLMGGNMLQPFDSVKEGIPTLVVAAIFQKDPQCILAHPGQGLDTWLDLKKATLLIGNDGLQSFYQWMISEYGFTEEQVKPYTYNLAPFLQNKDWAQQGYITAEPMRIEEVTGYKPNAFLLADNGWSTYSTTIETRAELVENNPGLVQRFVDASLIGWDNYLYGDNSQANELLKKDNPELSDQQIAFSINAMKEQGIVDSGDALSLGIGAITDERVNDFYDKMLKAGLYQEGEVDISKAYTTRFVNKGVGMDIKKIR